MLAYVMDGPGRGGLEELPDPTIGDYDVAVRMLACGVCSSTDKMLRLGTFSLGVTYPSILGHESVGRVVRVGDRVRSYQVGDLLTRPSAYRPDRAPMDMYWGGFAEQGVVTDWAALSEDRQTCELRPRSDQVRLPGSTDAVRAALSISLSETFSVIVRHDILGKTVAVVGTGVAGLSFGAYAKMLGAAQVIAVGRRAPRLELAERLGADRGVLADDAASAIAESGGADFVFEASGQAKMIAHAYRWLKPGGHAVVYSAPDSPTQMDLFKSPRDATLTVASTREAAVLPGVVRMLDGGVINPDELVTHRYPFSEIAAAFEAIERGEVVKAVITFSQ
ncbi:zinc-binding dehydrogenase [Actinopolymorpha pittospori]